MDNQNTPSNGQPFNIGLMHDAGAVRENNEDSSWFPPQGMNRDLLAQRGWLFIVADGMGGYQAGDVASRLAVEAASQSYYGDHETDDIMERLRQAAQDAQHAIITHQTQVLAGAQIGSTLVMALIIGADLYVANIGDSRCYRMRDGVLTQLSRDHSWVADQVRAGLLTEEEAKNNPHRNILTRGLGQTAKYAKPDIDKFDWNSGDRLLLCSDGLWDAVADEQLAALINTPDPQEAANAMRRAALEAAASDNVTALIVASAEAAGAQTAPVAVSASTTQPLPTTNDLAAPSRVTAPITDSLPSTVPADNPLPAPPPQRSTRLTTPILVMAGIALILVFVAAVIMINQVLTQPRTAAFAKPTSTAVPTAVMVAGNDKPTSTNAPTVTPAGVAATQTFSDVQAANTPVAAEPSPTAPLATVTSMPVIAAGQCVTRAISRDDWQWKSNLVKVESDSIAILGLAAPIESKATFVELLGLPELRVPFTIRVVARSKQWIESKQLWVCFPLDSKTPSTSCPDMQKVIVKSVALDPATSTRTFEFNYSNTPVNQHLRLMNTSNFYVYLMEIGYCVQ